MKKVIFILLSLLFSASWAAAQSGSLCLAKEGKTDYVISLADDAIPAERTAAVQFQKYFTQITGADIPIQTREKTRNDAPQILIGAGAEAKVLLPQQHWDELGSDGIIAKKSSWCRGKAKHFLYAALIETPTRKQ